VAMVGERSMAAGDGVAAAYGAPEGGAGGKQRRPFSLHEE
jgi:hypothetical protein